MALICKKGYFDLLFTFFSYQGKLQKFLQHISHSHAYMCFAHPIAFFNITNFEKLTNLSGTVSQSINNKMVSKISVGMSTTDIYLH